MDVCEGIVVRRHAVVLEVGNGRHALLRHVLLREHHGQFLGAVAAEVEAVLINEDAGEELTVMAPERVTELPYVSLGV